jgi:hypothetical protein
MVTIMSRILKLVPATGIERPGLRPLRGALRATLVRLAFLAIRLAMRLEIADARARGKAALRAPLRHHFAAVSLSVSLVEAVVYLAMTALFVVGLLGVFIA